MSFGHIKIILIFMLMYSTAHSMERPPERQFHFTPTAKALELVAAARLAEQRSGNELVANGRVMSSDLRTEHFLQFYATYGINDLELIPDVDLIPIISDLHALQALLVCAQESVNYMQTCDECVFMAVVAGAIPTLNFFTRNGYPINRLSSNGENALHRAIELGRLDIVQYLVSRGADVNAMTRRNQAPLDLVEVDNLAMIEVLIGHGARRSGTNQSPAADDQKIMATFDCEMILGSRLIDDPRHSETSSSGGQARLRSTPAAAGLATMERPPLQLRFTVSAEAHQLIAAVRDGVRPENMEGGTTSTDRMQQFLIIYYFNSESNFRYMTDRDFIQLLNDAPMLQALLVLTRELPNFSNICNDAVFLCANCGLIDPLRFFLDSGYDIERFCYDGENALHKAVRKGMFDVVHFLVRRGANVNAPTRRRESPLDLAHTQEIYHNELIIEFLIAQGAIRLIQQHYVPTDRLNPAHRAGVSVNKIATNRPVEENNVLSTIDSEKTQQDHCLELLRPWQLSQPLCSLLHLLPGDVLGVVRAYVLGRDPHSHNAPTTAINPNQVAAGEPAGAIDEQRRVDLQRRREEFVMCASLNNIPGVERLLREGVDINVQDGRGFTALMYAARNGYFSMVQFLLSAGARTDIEQIEVIGWQVYARTVFDFIPDAHDLTFPDPDEIFMHNFLRDKYEAIRRELELDRPTNQDDAPVRREFHERQRPTNLAEELSLMWMS